jgi:hypothetical protein
MAGFKLGGFQPAVNRFLVLAPDKKTVADVIIAQSTVCIYLLGKIKHLFCQIVLSHLSISDYAITIAGLK